MLVTPGQPVEIVREIVDVDGGPFDPAVLPSAVAVPAGRAYPSLDPVPADPVTCTVRQVEPGLYAARVPASVLATIGPATIAWTWDDGGAQTASDPLEVTPFAVATPVDIARLPGNKASDTTMQQRLRALSAATRDFENATNLVYSPRLQTETLPYPGPLPFADDVLGSMDVTPLTDGTAIYAYVRGLPAPPEDVTRAVAILASSYVADGPFDDRGYAMSDEGGSVRLLTAGIGRAMFSIPVVEATAKRWRIPGFA